MLVAIPLLALCLFSALFGPDGARTAAAQNSPRPDANSAQRVVVNDGDVVSLYSTLVSMPRRDRVGTFRGLSSAMKAALWRHHVAKVEAEHPEFSPEQRSIIHDFMSFLTPESYQLSANDPRFKTLVEEPLEQIRGRAFAAFPRDLVVALFLDMQPGARAPRAAALSIGRPRPADISACNCSRDYDDCFYWEGSGSYCNLGGCYWAPDWGCGPGFLFRCDGYCTPPDPDD